MNMAESVYGRAGQLDRAVCLSEEPLVAFPSPEDQK